MQIKEVTKKSYKLCSRANAIELVQDLMSNPDVVHLSFTEKTWIKGEDDEKFDVDLEYREKLNYDTKGTHRSVESAA